MYHAVSYAYERKQNTLTEVKILKINSYTYAWQLPGDFHSDLLDVQHGTTQLRNLCTKQEERQGK